MQQIKNKTSKWAFYFFAETNNATSHPINDHPKSHDAQRVRAQSSFERLFAAAR